MTQLVKIGNSQGIRIPKLMIKKTQLENKELILQVVDNVLLITPCKTARENWQAQCEAMIASHGHEVLDKDWLDAVLVDSKGLD